MRTLKVKTLTRTVVDFFNGLLDLSVGHLCKIASLGKVLAKQSIGVLVQPTLPGVVWIGKVDINAQRGCNLDVTGKLLTIVKSDCVQAIRISAEQSVNFLWTTSARMCPWECSIHSVILSTKVSAALERTIDSSSSSMPCVLATTNLATVWWSTPVS